MHIWSIKKLSNAIATNSLSEKSKLLNLITSVLIITVLSLVNISSGYTTITRNTNLMKFIPIVNLTVLLVGIMYCYIQNKSVDNSNFIERFILFSLPAIVRTTIVALVLGFIIGIAQPIQQLPGNSVSLDVQMGGIGIGCFCLFFLWVSNGITMIGKIKTNRK